jgi:hypothetical protein
VALLVFGVLARAIVTSEILMQESPVKPEPTVRKIGTQLMTHYVLPLEAMGLLLTAATIGAVIIALQEPSTKPKNRDEDLKTDQAAGASPGPDAPTAGGHA